MAALDAIWLNTQERSDNRKQQRIDQALFLALIATQQHDGTAIALNLGDSALSLQQLPFSALHTERLAPTADEQITTIELDHEQHWLHCSQQDARCFMLGPLPSVSPSLWPTIIFYSLLAAFFVFWLTPIFRGLSKLGHAASTFTTELRYRDIAPETPQPIKPIAQRFDEMANTITGLITSQQDITNGLSHELRTPLARMKFAVAAIDKNVANSNLLDSIETDIEEIDGITAQLLSYARLDQVHNDVACTEISTASLLADVQHNNIYNESITVDIQHDIESITANTELMLLALNNLMKNAFRYARERIIVSVYSEENCYFITIADDGIGIDDDLKTSVLQPFKKTTESDGFGFGLAFVNKVMQRHEGHVRIENNTPSGCKITLSWPKKIR